MTGQYDPFSDFWGDFVNGFVVVIIATQIQSNKPENSAGGSKSLARIIDDFIIFNSLHAANLYWLILENKIIAIIIILLFSYYIFCLKYTDPKRALSSVIGERWPYLISLFSLFNALIFTFCSSMRNLCLS